MPTSALLAELHSAAPLVCPSLLAADFANLGQEIRRLEQAGARILHLDIMDGHFVPNLSFGVPVVEAIRRVTRLPLDVHLMLREPGRYIEVFRRAGADLLTIHIEAAPDPVPLLRSIRHWGAGAGIAYNPTTPVAAIEPFLAHCDLVLTMSVMPGFGGQAFDPVALSKLRLLRERAGPGVLLSVDGGVNLETIGPCVQAGAALLVVGTALFEHRDYEQRLGELTGQAQRFAQVQV